MRTKVTLLLLLLNAALFLFIFVFEREWRRERETTASRLVLGSEAAAIQVLEITGESTHFRFHQPAPSEPWMIESPVRWPANEFALRRILNELQFLEHETSFLVSDLEPNGQTLADYGLAEPRLTLAYAPAPDTPLSLLRIGGDTSVGNRFYLLSPDSTRIHVVSRSLLESIALSLPSLLADTVFTIPVFESRALNLQSGGSSGLRVRLRRDQTRWTFEAPIVTRAAKTPVELTINDLNALRVLTFLEPSEELRQGFVNPLHRITLEGNNRRETLLLGPTLGPGENDTIRHAARFDGRDPYFSVAVPPPLLTTLAQAQVALRDRRILDFDPTQIASVTLASPSQTHPLTLRRRELNPDRGWEIFRPAPDGSLQTFPADPLLVDRLLLRLSLLEATPPTPERSGFHLDAPSSLELENLGFNRPERTLTFSFLPPVSPAGPTSAPPPPLTLELALPGGTDPGLYARVKGQAFVYAVPSELLNLVPVTSRVFRDRVLRALPPEARVTSLSLRPASGGDPLIDLAWPDQAAWSALLAIQPENQRAALDEIRQSLRRLEAKSIVREDFPASLTVAGREQPWSHRLDATLVFPGQPEPVATTLWLAPRSGGDSQLAGSADFNLVFELSQPLLDAVWSLLYPDPGPPAP